MRYAACATPITTAVLERGSYFILSHRGLERSSTRYLATRTAVLRGFYRYVQQTKIDRRVHPCSGLFLGRECTRHQTGESISQLMKPCNRSASQIKPCNRSASQIRPCNGRSVCDSLICLIDRLHGRFRKVSRQQIVSKSGSRPMSLPDTPTSS